MKTEDCLLVGYVAHNKTDKACLTVGRKQNDKIVVLKVIVGEQATTMYNDLLAEKGEQHEEC